MNDKLEKAHTIREEEECLERDMIEEKLLDFEEKHQYVKDTRV